ncbi:MAG: hypothetical protein ABI664_10335 [bacterium]
MHVKIVFQGTRADVYVNHGQEPLLRVPELKRAPQSGKVAVWAGAPATGQMTFANYSASSHIDKPLSALAPAKASAGQLMQWKVSSRLAAPDTIIAPRELTSALRDALRAGRVVGAESDGLVNLTRIVGNPAGAQQENVFGGAGWGLALATATLDADRAKTVRLRFGFSDGISIFLNGARVFSGAHPYASPDLGRIVDVANEVELPLNKGSNELVFAVTDRAFGWGFRARIDPW